MKVTIKQIASESGVSSSTVSRYLNQGYVSDAASKKIAAVIKKYNYIPNSFARNLKAEESSYVGVIIPRMDLPSVMEKLDGIDCELRKHGLQILLINTELDDQREINSLYSLVQNNVAGIIVLSSNVTSEHCSIAKEHSIPIIFVGQNNNHVYTVGHDNYLAGKQLAEALLTYEHKNITFLGVAEKNIPVGGQRKRGVVETFEESGVSVQEVQTSFTLNDAYETGLKILKKPKSSLYVAATDQIAAGLYNAAQELDLAIGKDISIAGFGGYDTSRYLFPLLTTVDFHHRDVGRTVAKLLYDRINFKEIPKDVKIETSVKIGNSVANLAH